jgi:hypothetical protein
MRTITTKLFLALVLLLLTITVNAQGIAVQGIARNENNIARTTANITLKVLIHDEQDRTIHEEVIAKTTDKYGVFSAVINIDDFKKRTRIANNKASIKIFEIITDETTKIKTEEIISSSPLNEVPYAIAAGNGVPTGTVVPFLGVSSLIPDGWLMCDGKLIPNGIAYDKLKLVLGNATHTPDLRAMFLRGVGDELGDTESLRKGPGLRTVQQDGIKKHQHKVSHVADHTHKSEHPISQGGYSAIEGAGKYFRNVPIPLPPELKEHLMPLTTPSGGHNHIIDDTTDTTTTTNISETRPVSYGVNYIIKI